MITLFIILLILAFPIGIIIGWWIYYGAPKEKARALQNNFFKLGNLKGMTLEKIEAAVGKPESWHQVLNQTLYTWSAGNYRITLIFENGICEGILSESSSSV